MITLYLKEDAEVDVEETLNKMLEKYVAFDPSINININMGEQNVQLIQNKSLSDAIKASKELGETVSGLDANFTFNILINSEHSGALEYKPVENKISFYKGEIADFTKELEEAFKPYIDKSRKK